MEDAGAGGGGAALAVRGADRRTRATTWTTTSSHGTESYAEALTYFPDLTDYNLGPGRLPGARPPGQGRRRHPGHRQPQRRLAGGWIALRAADRAGRGRRAGAEHLLHPDRPGAGRAPRSSSDTSTWCATSRRQVQHPGGGEARPVLHAPANLARRLDAGGGGRAGAVQPLLPARLRPGALEVVPSLHAEQRRTSCGCRCTGSRSCTATSAPTWRSPAACTRRRTCSRR